MTALAAGRVSGPAPAATGRRRLLVVVADQAVNSVTNVVVVLVVAAAVPLAQFGVFAAVTLAVQLTQSVAGAGIGDRVLQAAPERREARYATGSRVLDLAAGLGVGVAVLAVLAFDASPWLVACALAPAAARVDLWRVRTIADGRTTSAFGVDLALGAGQVVGVVLWWRSGTPGGVGGAVAVWALVSLLTVLAVSLRRRADHAGRAPLAEAVSVRYGVEMAAVNGAGQIAQLAVTAQLGFTFSGTLRAAQVPFGIVVVLVLAARAVLIPAMRGASPEHARRLAWVAAGVAVAAAGVFTVVTVVASAVPPLRFLVGGVHLQTWFVVLLGLGYAAVGGGMVHTYFLRARHRDREVSVGRAVMLVLLAAGTVAAVITRSSWVFLATLAVSWAVASAVMAVVTPETPASR